MKEQNAKTIEELLIVSTDPSFLQRDVFWFSENESQIRRALQSDPFWQRNALYIVTGQKISLSEFLRQLDELGYEKKYAIKGPGQFSTIGGLVEIFPVNKADNYIIEFYGNTVEQIAKSKSPLDDKEREFFLKNRARHDADLLKTLKPGEYITHLDHGIGVYQGLQEAGADFLNVIPDSIRNPGVKDLLDSRFRGNDKTINALSKNEPYLVIHYAAPRTGAMPDRLLVPVRQIKKINRYLGFAQPVLHRLGSQVWERIRRKAKEDIIKLAQELLALYRQRHHSTRTPYQVDTEWEKAVAHTFAYQETEDQIRALDNVKKDLRSGKPMDRLIVGEVGFGKTEVALRTAAIVASNGFQVAFLCPTTILADQHYNNFKERLSALPLQVALLSRFEKKQDQRKTIAGLNGGSVDIVIGTHRLLSKDIRFKNLGLLIIDEEQRFGVKQKEKIKQFKASVDVLSLTATPIPRTLHLALAGLRDMSEIATPPPGRLSVQTHIGPWDEKIIREAISRELNRGQVYPHTKRGSDASRLKSKKGPRYGVGVYWLHNRIETIEKMREVVAKLAPYARISVAHGRLPELQLRKIMNEFRAGKKDILLTTTIIENGLDLPQVNTLIIDDASRLGLSQAHQLRGRIGRSHEQAFAYFFHPEKMTEQAALRLQALKDYAYLGAGLEIAKKDLEIRGAGNILGREQSGTLNQIGLNLYCQILNETIEELREKE